MNIRTERLGSTRIFDWKAVWDNYKPGDPIGYGDTEQQAIDDLKDDGAVQS